jgi:hypothetical protein
MCIFYNKLHKILVKKNFIWKSEKCFKKSYSPFVK